jgi:predicted nucleotidyltransferase
VTESLSAYADAAGLSGDPDIRQLVEAEARSGAALDLVREYIKVAYSGKRGLDIVAFGSLARKEWTDQSDFDYLVIVHALTGGVAAIREALKIGDSARHKLDASEPGATGMFGTVISAPELVARIGLETDTNQTLTRRLLILEESVSLYDPTEHDRLVLDILSRYLFEYTDRAKTGVARFLLNDVIRHWRTVAVDYQAKNWQRTNDDGWGLRYLKLRISRKLAFAGTLAPLVALAVEGLTPTASNLSSRLRPTPLGRLAALHGILHDDGRNALADALRIAGRFNRLLNSQTFRHDASAINGPGGDRTAEFNVAMEDSVRLQDALTEVFLGMQSPMRPLSEKYLIF